MAYIQPDTTIELYKNVPLDKSYRNTVNYSDSTAQYNDFKQYKYKTYEKQSYQRWGLGTIRIEEQHDSIYDCNYMIFYNPTLKKKIYCFVDGVSYVSNNVTEVYYTIDVLQTYMFEYSFGKCFVEREHTYTDIQGTNTQPEGLELGAEYVNDGTPTEFIVTSFRYIILATQRPSGVTPVGLGLRNGIPDGLVTMVFDNVTDLSNKIAEYINAGLEDAIVQLYMAPTNSTYNNNIEYQHTKLNAYTPKNKKLLTYPYCYVQVGNNLGNYVELHYERMGALSTDAKRKLEYRVTTLDFPQPIMVFEPNINYISPNRAYQLTYSVFPTCAFAGDSFKVWWAQNKNTYIATMNAIQSNYDTNMAVAQNNYQQAMNSAQATRQATLNSIATGLSNAEMQKNTAKDIAHNNYKNATSGWESGVGDVLSTVISNVTGKTYSTGGASVGVTGNVHSVGGHISANSATQNSLSIGARLANSVNAINLSASNTQTNAGLNADLAYDVASATASTNTVNAELAFSTAKKNATLSQASANLTALTTAQNATAQLVAKKQDAMHQPATAHGQSSCDGANVTLNRVGFYFEGKCISPEYASKIDDYFSMYGYAVNELKTPNLNNRKYFTYLKTANCNLSTRRMDAQTRQTIEGIYNNGITTWKELSQVGNYDLDNTPNGAQY